MKNPERVFNDRVKTARGLLREIIDLADLQGWTFRVKDDGLLFFAPPQIARPGFDKVYARDPGSDSALQRQIKDRFRKAGMKFPEDHLPERKPKVSQIPSKPPAVAAVDSFSLIAQKINSTVGLLSEIEGLVKKIQQDQAKLKVLGDALKSLSGM